MKTISILALGILIGGALFGSLNLLNAQERPHQEAGRYSVAAFDDNKAMGVVVIDSTTGQQLVARVPRCERLRPHLRVTVPAPRPIREDAEPLGRQSQPLAGQGVLVGAEHADTVPGEGWDVGAGRQSLFVEGWVNGVDYADDLERMEHATR